MERFWHIEELSEDETVSSDHKAVERLFRKEHSRTSDGRYIVKIPLKEKAKLGESRNIVHRSFYQLEKRMQANDVFRQKYIDNMRDFIKKGYIKKAEFTDKNEVVNYIPHHAIDTKKFKTVFDFRRIIQFNPKGMPKITA